MHKKIKRFAMRCLILIVFFVLAGLVAVLANVLLSDAEAILDVPDAIHVRITKEELLVNGQHLSPIVNESRSESLEFPDSIWAGLVLGSLIEAIEHDPRRTVLFEADSSTPSSLYLVALQTIRSTGRRDLVLRVEGRDDLRLTLLDLESPENFVDLSRMIDSVYVVLAWDSGGAFYDRPEQLPGVGELGREDILDKDSLATRLASPARTPVRRSAVVNVEFLAPRFGGLHEFLSLMDKAIASRPEEDRFPLVLNVEFWLTAPGIPICGGSCGHSRCGEPSGPDSSIERRSRKSQRN